LASATNDVIKKLIFMGGSSDGKVIEGEYGRPPDVIDGDSQHFYGDAAYILTTLNWETGEAAYVHAKMNLIEMDD
jgi:hypothetical protein